MTAITKTSMKDQVYQIIKEKIFTLEYNFGDTINISALSSELGVSNTPIREALSRLEVEGLVTSTLNSKVQVIDITEDLYKDIDHTFFNYIRLLHNLLFGRQNRVSIGTDGGSHSSAGTGFKGKGIYELCLQGH